jgi:hypothetical protein
MKKIVIIVLALSCFAVLLDAQVAYKQNFLLSFSKQPDIKTCEAAYSFACCNNDVCAAFLATKAALMKALEELTAVQVALNNATVSSSAPAITAEDGKKLAAQLKNMTPEEKQRWAMQNAKNFMPKAALHVNKDMDNQPVTDAVKCVTDQQAKDLQNFNALNELRMKIGAIEKKYESKKEEAVKTFQSVTGTLYDPSSTIVYAVGEMSDAEGAKFEKAVGEYRKTILPLYNSELSDKLMCVRQAEQELVSTYMPIEEKIASTNYADQAQENSNKMHLIMGHMNVLQKVKTTIDMFDEIFSRAADQYAALMKAVPVKELNEKKN